jgi:hypothetical protein
VRRGVRAPGLVPAESVGRRGRIAEQGVIVHRKFRLAEQPAAAAYRFIRLIQSTRLSRVRISRYTIALPGSLTRPGDAEAVWSIVSATSRSTTTSGNFS